MNTSLTRAISESNAQQTRFDSMDVFQRIVDLDSIQSNCYSQETPIMKTPRSSIPKDNIDIESELRGQNVIISKYGETRVKECTDCNDIKYTPECTNNTLIPEHTRYHKPQDFLRGINVNRFHPLCQNYQDAAVIPTNDIIGLNTRITAKDNFVPKTLN